jgi:hypothetical protein
MTNSDSDDLLLRRFIVTMFRGQLACFTPTLFTGHSRLCGRLTEKRDEPEPFSLPHQSPESSPQHWYEDPTHLSRDPDDRPSISKNSSLVLSRNVLSTTEQFRENYAFDLWLFTVRSYAANETVLVTCLKQFGISEI